MTGEVPQEWRDATINVLHKKKNRTEYRNYRGLSLMAHAGKVLLKIVANRLGDFCEEAGILPDEECGFRPQRSTTDMMCVVRRLQELGRTSNASLEICFIDLAKAYDSVDRVLLWEVLARFGVPPRMIKVIRMFYDGMRARVQLNDGDFSAWFNVTGTNKQRFPRDLLHRSGKSIRLGRPCAIMGSTCPFWSSASDDQGHPHVLRWYEGSRTVE